MDAPATTEVARTGSPRLAVAVSEIHGRGVFAVDAIAAGTVIEICPVLRVPAAQRDHLDATLVFEYYFAWGDDAGIALGFGSLYNHDADPAARYRKRLDDDVVEIVAVRDIAAGEEITISYSG